MLQRSPTTHYKLSVYTFVITPTHHYKINIYQHKSRETSYETTLSHWSRLSGGNGFSFGLAVSKASGKVFVSNSGSNTILGFAATARGNVAPIQTIAGGGTGLADPLGLAVTQ
jgi:DNA-binding beta-propeller fold protein YncE